MEAPFDGLLDTTKTTNDDGNIFMANALDAVLDVSPAYC